MQPKDKKQFTEAMQALAATYQREATKALLTGYWMGLSDMPLDAFQKAVATALHSLKFMPSPAELRELGGEMRLEDRAIIAFSAFDKAVTKHGYYTTVTFDDPAINATVRTLGGWEAVCDTPLDQWNSFFRKRFLDTYCAHVRRGVHPEDARPLVGYIDKSNALHWKDDRYNPREPVKISTGLPITPLIGNAERPQTIRLPSPGPRTIGEVFNEKKQA